MNRQRTAMAVSLAAGLAAVCLLSAPGADASLDFDSKIIDISTQARAIADEITHLRATGLTEEPPRVILLWAACNAEGCTREYLVVHPFSRGGWGHPRCPSCPTC